MGHRSTRIDTQARAERCWRLRIRGRTWQEIADHEGFRHRRAAQKAVEQFLRRTPPTDTETLRRAMGDGLTMIREKLLDSLDAAHAKGDHRGVAMIGTAAAETIEKQAKLMGLHIAVPKQIDVTVHQTMAQIIDDTRAKLMAAIDAEIVELPELVTLEPVR